MQMRMIINYCDVFWLRVDAAACFIESRTLWTKYTVQARSLSNRGPF